MDFYNHAKGGAMKLLLYSSIFFFLAHAKAGLLIEPVVGYNATKVEYDNASGTFGTGAIGGVFGGRLGLTILDTIFIAGDYIGGDLSWEPEGAINQELDGSVQRVGISAGIDMPVLPIRVWAGYFESEFSADLPSVGEYLFENGDGIKAGIGFTFLPIIDINFEYYSAEYDKYSIAGVEQNFKAVDKGAVVSISAPFSL